MGKGVGADDRLVGLHRHAGEIADQAGGFVDLLGSDAGERFAAAGVAAQEGIEVAAAHMHRHHQLLQGGIAGPLADPVDRALELAGAVLHGL